LKPTLVPGLEHTHVFTVPDEKTVPHLYPESDIFAAMPRVFATGFMVGLVEWTCAELLRPHLDEGEGSLGVHIDLSHTAPTPPGMAVTVLARLAEVDGRRLVFHVSALDEVEPIGEGRHKRFVVDWDRFNAKLREKAARVGKRATKA